MKARFTIMIFLLGVLLNTTFGQTENSMNIYFPTLGNCYLCKLRIEEAVNNLQGIESVTWDYVTKVTDVTFNDEIMDAFQIMHSIADVGHDTEWFAATDSAYNTLVGTCCEYERTMDYTIVEVGYLSLMGIWVYPLTGISDFETIKCNVFPTVSHGLFTIEMAENLINTQHDLVVFSMSGQKVFTLALSANSRNSIDVSFLEKGNYIIVLSGDKKVIAQEKIIIN